MFNSKKENQMIGNKIIKREVSSEINPTLQKIQILDFPAVSKTALMTLYCRAMDYKAKNSILNDKFSYDLYHRIEFDWQKVKKKLKRHDYLLTAIRVRKFDEMCKKFLQEHPRGIIVNLGSGVDYRFARIDNGELTFVEIDFSEVLEFKKKIIPKHPNNIFIGKSILDYSWIPEIKDLSQSLDESVFFIAEGLLPYLEKSEIKELFSNIRENFPQSELFFDLIGEKMVKLMSKHSGIQDWVIELKSGFKSGYEIENWGIGFKLIEEWFYPDDPDAKRGLMKLMWIIPLFRYSLFFIYGKLDIK